MAIEVKEDGYEEVKVILPDGAGESSVRLDVYLTGFTLSEAAKSWRAAGDPTHKWVAATQVIFADLGLPGLSGKAANDLANQILTAFEAIEGKPSATPQAG